MNNEMNYKHYISLGYFCSVAMELERIGLRSASYPFDWLVTPRMSNVMEMIETHFEGFLEENCLRLKDGSDKIYINSQTGFSFVHDFEAKKSLSEQIDGVRQKFERRIERFYRDIEEPTLFVRYISDEAVDTDGRFEDLAWISDNFMHINEVVKSFNADNDIIWIANSSIRSDALPRLYIVDKDENDTVARRPLDRNKELNGLLMSVDYPGRVANLQVYERKQRKQKSLVNRIRNHFAG